MNQGRYSKLSWPVELTLLFSLALSARFSPAPRLSQTKAAPQSVATALPGQTSTVLPNGDQLLLGGQGSHGPVTTAAIKSSTTGIVLKLPTGLSHARAFHSASLLPNGKVFIVGGVGASGSVEPAEEMFDPQTDQFTDIQTAALVARAHHSATVLTDGTLLLVGGISGSGDILSTAQLWHYANQSAQFTLSPLHEPRKDQSAVLQADGTVFIFGGTNVSDNAETFSEVYEPTQQSFAATTQSAPMQPSSGAASTAEIVPTDGAQAVSPDVVIAIRFSKPQSVATVSPKTAILATGSTAVAVRVTPTERGMLAFITPQSALKLGTTYTLTIDGAAEQSGNRLQTTTVSFTTVQATLPPANTSQSGSSDMWLPTAFSYGQGHWTSGNSESANRLIPPLSANPGETALAGQSLGLSGAPLRGVTFSIDDQQARSDETGRFLLENLTPGHHVLLIDGTTASRRGATYGVFQAGVNIAAGKTNVLPYTVWMTALDTAHEVTIPSPTSSETVVTNPNLPGLELHIPAGTVIRDRTGKAVTKLSITPIPIDQPPFPLPPHVRVPIYFTIQPGDAYIDSTPGAWSKGARLFYPNSSHSVPGTNFNFWNYDPADKGWFIYGQGSVAANGKQIVPDLGVEIYEFTGAMVDSKTYAPLRGPRPGDPSDGDPVDLGTGLFVYQKTDLALNDIIPISLTRTYRESDTTSRAFGIGTSHPYDIFLIGDTFPYTYAELVLQDGSRIRYDRISSGTGYTDAVYIHTSTNTVYYGSQIAWNGTGWNLTFKDGTIYQFPDSYLASSAQAGALIGIIDRYGNTVTISRDTSSNLSKITTPSGRWIQLTYDSSNRVTQAQDNIGRTVSYTYSTAGDLTSVTDAAGGVWNYTYDSSHEMLTIEDPRSIVYLTNQYDSNGRVTKQTQADSTYYQFSYTLTSNTEAPFAWEASSSYTGPGAGQAVMEWRACSGCYEGYPPEISQVDVTDPRGYVREVQFGSTGYQTSDERAKGQPEQQTTTYTYYPDNLLESMTDPLGRTTAYTYDVNGNPTQIVQLSGTSSPVTTTMTYTTTYNELATLTDPLSHTTAYSYDSSGNLTSLTDPLSHEMTFTSNGQGQPTSVTDASGNVTSFGYSGGNLVQTTDPLGRTSTGVFDNAGRMITVTTGAGGESQYTYNAFDELTASVDAFGNTTSFSYNGNGRLVSNTDANSHVTTYAYDTMDRLSSRTDSLSNGESYAYDADGNLVSFTDRRGQLTSYGYDGLDRMTFVGFNATSGPTYDSTISNTYDAGNRLTQAVDSIAGTFSRGFDGLDRLTSETTPLGSVSYGYDAAGRRTTMQVAGQSQVSYAYDNANRLTQVAQGSATTSLGYDVASRRTSLTLPNGIVVSYAYDNASQLSSLTYSFGSTVLGNLTYGYDLAGRRTAVAGSMAAVNLPSAVSTTSYNANNQLTQWGTASLYYDANGNMTSDGTNSYTWDSRNHLASMNFAANTFEYDPFGRRIGKTIGSLTTNYLYDGINVAQELTGTTPSANLLSGGLDQVFTRTDSYGTVDFLPDALGSTIGLTNSSGVLQTQYGYAPFGNVAVSGSSNANTYQYIGREDDGTGLDYFRARYYSPSLQRFVSEDPLGLAGNSVNLYEYVYDNPVTRIDPLGLQEIILSEELEIDPDLINQAKQLAAPENSLPMPDGGRLDISGRAHIDPATEQPIPTPHVHEPPDPFDPPYDLYFRRGLQDVPRPATPDDFIRAIRHNSLPAIPLLPLPGRKPQAPIPSLPSYCNAVGVSCA